MKIWLIAEDNRTEQGYTSYKSTKDTNRLYMDTQEEAYKGTGLYDCGDREVPTIHHPQGVGSVDHSKDKGWRSRDSDIGRQRIDVSEVYGEGGRRREKRRGRRKIRKGKWERGKESEERMREENSQEERIGEDREVERRGWEEQREKERGKERRKEEEGMREEKEKEVEGSVTSPLSPCSSWALRGCPMAESYLLYSACGDSNSSFSFNALCRHPQE